MPHSGRTCQQGPARDGTSYPANDFYPGGDTGTECPFSYDPYLCDLCDMSNPNGMYNEYDCSLYGGYTYSSSGDPGYCDYASPNYDYYLCDICDGSSPYFDQYSCEYSGGTVFNISGSNNDPYGPGLTYPLNGGTPILEFTYNSNELVDLGFDFGFYGDTYNQITVSSNGLIYFGDVPYYENGCCSGSLLPAVTPAPTIHLFHTEFFDSSYNGGGIYINTYGTAPNREFVVSYYNVPEYYSYSSCNAQVILRENDGSIELYHGGFNSPYGYNGITVGLNAGDGIHADFDGAFNAAYMTAPTTFIWTLEAPSSSAAHPWPTSWNQSESGTYAHTFDLPEALSGSGSGWSLITTNTHESGQAADFTVAASMSGLTPQSPSLTIHPVNDPFLADFILEGAQGTPAPVTVTQNGGTAVTFLTTAVERDTVLISIAGSDADVLDTYTLTGQPTQGTATLEVIPAGALGSQEYAAELPAMGSAPDLSIYG